jgi:hypothetical protein
MTEQPPVTPENPEESGEDLTTPTQTEQDAAKAAQLAEIQSTEYSMSDQLTYAQMIYDQPAWVVEAMFQSGTLDPNQKYTPGQVQAAMDNALQETDKQFVEEAP